MEKKLKITKLTEQEILIADRLREVDEFGDLIPIEIYIEKELNYIEQAKKDLSRKEWRDKIGY